LPVGNAFEFKPGALYRAMINGDWFLADEFNLADPGIMNMLFPILEGQKQIRIPGTEIDIVAHPRFRFFATQNGAAYANRHKLSSALRHRFLELQFADFPVDELAVIIRDRNDDSPLHQINNIFEAGSLIPKQMAQLYHHANIRNVPVNSITMREIIKWTRRKAQQPNVSWGVVGFYLLSSRLSTLQSNECIKLRDAFIDVALLSQSDAETVMNVWAGNGNCTIGDEDAVGGSCVFTEGNQRVVLPNMRAPNANLSNCVKRSLFKVALAVQNHEPVMLVGDSCYKSYLLNLWESLQFPNSEEFGPPAPAISVNLKSETDTAELLGEIRPYSIADMLVELKGSSQSVARRLRILRQSATLKGACVDISDFESVTRYFEHDFPDTVDKQEQRWKDNTRSFREHVQQVSSSQQSMEEAQRRLEKKLLFNGAHGNSATVSEYFESSAAQMMEPASDDEVEVFQGSLLNQGAVILSDGSESDDDPFASSAPKQKLAKLDLMNDVSNDVESSDSDESCNDVFDDMHAPVSETAFSDSIRSAAHVDDGYDDSNDVFNSPSAASNTQDSPDNDGYEEDFSEDFMTAHAADVDETNISFPAEIKLRLLLELTNADRIFMSLAVCCGIGGLDPAGATTLNKLWILFNACVNFSQSSGNPSFLFHDGPVTRAAKLGRTLFLEDFDLPSASVIERLNSVLETTSSFSLSEDFTVGRLTADSESGLSQCQDTAVWLSHSFQVFATVHLDENQALGALLSPATRSRFTLVYCSSYNSTELQNIVSQELSVVVEHAELTSVIGDIFDFRNELMRVAKFKNDTHRMFRVVDFVHYHSSAVPSLNRAILGMKFFYADELDEGQQLTAFNRWTSKRSQEVPKSLVKVFEGISDIDITDPIAYDRATNEVIINYCG
jgi:hypothetical protein